MKSSLARLFGSCAFLAGIAAATCPSASAQSPLGLTSNAIPASAALAITHGQFLQAPSETGFTVSWATSRKCVSRVEYRLESSEHWLTNIPAHHGLVDADVTVHNVPLTGLEPGTHYRYRVVSREIAEFKPYKVTYGATVTSPEYRFNTLEARKPSTAFVSVVTVR